MAEIDPSDDRMANERPVEGYVSVPGSRLIVNIDCLGRSFKSRITLDGRSYSLTIGLPKLDPASPSDGPLIAPEWIYGQTVKTERSSISWGQVTGQHKDRAYIFRCGYNTTIPPVGGGEFADFGWELFQIEFGFWWRNFTSWAAISASQDILGPPEWDWREPELEAWVVEPHGLQAHTSRFSFRGHGPAFRVLEAHDLEACARAAGKHGPPPVAWELLRDARAEANTGDEMNGCENFRRSIIDAAAAIELAMPALVDRYLDGASVPRTLIEVLAKGRDELGGAKELLGLLKPGLIRNSQQETLISKQSGASHRANHYYWQEAELAVEIASAVVEAAYPVAGYLQVGPEADR